MEFGTTYGVQMVMRQKKFNRVIHKSLQRENYFYIFSVPQENSYLRAPSAVNAFFFTTYVFTYLFIYFLKVLALS